MDAILRELGIFFNLGEYQISHSGVDIYRQSGILAQLARSLPPSCYIHVFHIFLGYKTADSTMITRDFLRRFGRPGLLVER